MTLPRILLETILPVIVLAGLGALLRRRVGIDPKPLSQVIFYAFLPALVFRLLVDNPFSLSDMFRMAAFTTVLLVALAVVAWALARLLHLSRTLTSAVILCIVFMNAGNLGLPITQLALGDISLAWASVFYATMALLANSAGAWIASVGRASPRQALVGLARVPSVYAIPLALLVHGSGVTLPPLVRVPVGLLAGAAAPSMLLLLGMQLTTIGSVRRVGLLGLVAGARLVLSPALASAMTLIAGLPPAAAQAGILEAAMPTAVLNTILASQYDVEPEFVSSAVLVTTLLSPLSLSAVLLLRT